MLENKATNDSATLSVADAKQEFLDSVSQKRETLTLKPKEQDYVSEELPQEEVREEYSEDTSEEQADKKLDGYVDVQDPAVRKRIDTLWKESREAREHARKLEEQNRLYAERLASLENNVQQRFFESDKQNEEAILQAAREEMRSALQEGNFDKYEQINDMYQKAVLNKTVREMSLAQEAQRRQSAPAQSQGFDKDFQQALGEWSNAKDNQGHLLRPYMQQNHSLHEEANQAFEQALINKGFKSLQGIEKKPWVVFQALDEVDRKMQSRISKRASTPSVLSSNAPSIPTKHNGLSDQHKYIAQALGLSAEEYADGLKQYGKK